MAYLNFSDNFGGTVNNGVQTEDYSSYTTGSGGFDDCAQLDYYKNDPDRNYFIYELEESGINGGQFILADKSQITAPSADLYQSPYVLAFERSGQTDIDCKSGGVITTVPFVDTNGGPGTQDDSLCYYYFIIDRTRGGNFYIARVLKSDHTKYSIASCDLSDFTSTSITSLEGTEFQPYLSPRWGASTCKIIHETAIDDYTNVIDITARYYGDYEPIISTANRSGSNLQLTGHNLTNYNVNYTNKELFTDLTTELKNGATLVENAVMGGGGSLDSASNQYISLGSIINYSGSVSGSIFIKLSDYSSSDTQGIIAKNELDSLLTDVDLEIWCVSGNLYLTFYETYAFPPTFKSIVYDIGQHENNETISLVFSLDLTVGTNAPKLYINGSIATTFTPTNHTFTNLEGFTNLSIGQKYDLAGAYNTLDGQVSSLMLYNGVYSEADCKDIYNNTQYYYKNGGTGNLNPITPDSTTSTTATFSGIDENGTIYVFNKDGFDSYALTSTYYEPVLTLTQDLNSISFKAPQYGNMASIKMPIDYIKKSNGEIDAWDNGSSYDKYVFDAKFLLNHDDAEDLITFYSSYNRGEELTLTPPDGYALTPFSPSLGAEGPFTCKIISISQSGVLQSPYKYYQVEVRFQLTSATPGSTDTPTNKDEGSFQIGTVAGLKCPVFNPKIDYRINHQGLWGYNVVTTDKKSVYPVTSFELDLDGGKMKAVIDYLLSQRTGTINLVGPTDSYIYGEEIGSSGTFYSKLLTNELIVTQTDYNRYKLPLTFQWRGTA